MSTLTTTGRGSERPESDQFKKGIITEPPRCAFQRHRPQGAQPPLNGDMVGIVTGTALSQPGRELEDVFFFPREFIAAHFPDGPIAEGHKLLMDTNAAHIWGDNLPWAIRSMATKLLAEGYYRPGMVGVTVSERRGVVMRQKLEDPNAPLNANIPLTVYVQGIAGHFLWTWPDEVEYVPEDSLRGNSGLEAGNRLRALAEGS